MHYTPIEQRIIDLLSDGLPHDRDEVIQCIDPNVKDLVRMRNSLSVHIAHIRSKVRLLGQDVVTELRRGGIHYRHMILLPGTKLCEDPV